MVETTCSNCKNKKSFDDDKSGKKFKCPNCGNIVLIEKPGSEKIVEEKKVEIKKIESDKKEESPKKEFPKTEIKDKKSFYIGLIAIIIGAVCYYFYNSYQVKEQEAKVKAQQEAAELAMQKAQHISDSIASYNVAILAKQKAIQDSINEHMAATLAVQTAKQDSINAYNVSQPSITEELKLVSGDCTDDGCTFLFKNKEGKKIVSSQLPENSVEFDDFENSGASSVKPKYLNKKYSVQYKIGSVFHEPTNSYNDEMIISKMELIK